VFAKEGNILKVNPAWERMLGFTQKELLDMSWSDLVHPDDFDKTNEEVEKQLAGNSVVNFVNRFRCKDGSFKSLEWQATITTEGIVHATARDITERTLAEEQIEFLSEITKQGVSSVTITDLEFKITWVNDAFLELYGYEFEEIIGKLPDILNNEPLAAEIQQEIYKTVKAGNKYIGEAANVKKDGSVFQCEFEVFPIFDVEGGIIAYSGHQKDITERKQAENTIRKSETRIRDLMQTVPIGISITSPEGEFLEINSAMVEIFGYDSKEEFENINADALYSNSKDRERFVNLIKKGPVKDFELQYKHKDGSLFWGSTSSLLTTTAAGETEFINTLRDITERVLAVQALIDSEFKYGQLVDSSPDGIFSISNTGQVLSVNESFCKLTGYEKNDFVGKSILKAPTLILQEKDFYSRMIKDALQGKMEGIIQFNWKHANGEIRIGDAKVNVLRLNDKIEGVIGTIRDITERVQMENTLRESEIKYRNLFAQIADPIFIFDKETSFFLYCNQTALDLYGYTLEELRNMTPHQLHLPGEQVMVDQNIHDHEDLTLNLYTKKPG